MEAFGADRWQRASGGGEHGQLQLNDEDGHNSNDSHDDHHHDDHDDEKDHEHSDDDEG